MITGPRWLLSATAGIALLAPSAAHAQARPGTRPSSGAPATAPAVPAPTTTPRRSAEGSFQAPAPIRPGQPISVLVFPFTAASAGEIQPAPAAGAPAPGAAPAAPARPAAANGEQDVAAALTAAVNAGFLSTPAYSVVSYHANSALVQRAKAGEILKADDLKDLTTAEGGINAEKAKYLAYRLGLQTYLVGTVETKTDPKANSAELTLDAQLVNSTTGEVIRSAAASGAAAGAAGVPMDAVLERAAQETAQKVLPALGIELVPLQTRAAAPPAADKKHKTRTERPKSEKKSRTDKKAEEKNGGDKKAAREARKAEEKAQRDAKEAAEKAAEQAKKQQHEQERLARDASRKAERDAEKARHEADKARKEQPKAPAASSTGASVTPEKAPVVQQDLQPAQPPAGAQRPADTAKGTANAAGQPIPYGYALGETKQALPTRHRNNIKVPAWLGVASFLTGVSFLL